MRPGKWSVGTVGVVVVALAALLTSASAIRCFQCNSVNDAACFNLKADHANASKYLKECEGDPSIPQDAKPFCRKIVITVLKEGHRRVVRKCGYIDDRKPCYQRDDEDHNEIVCQCFGDACNGASRTSTVGALVTTGVASLVMYLICVR